MLVLCAPQRLATWATYILKFHSANFLHLPEFVPISVNSYLCDNLRFLIFGQWCRQESAGSPKALRLIVFNCVLDNRFSHCVQYCTVY